LILEVSEGKAVAVPDVRGKELDEAQALLEDSGFKVIIQKQDAPEEQENQVIAYAPTGPVAPGSTITLTIGERMDEDKGKGRGRNGDD
jgi:beta-lactam-binding protein with PASTA domain